LEAASEIVFFGSVFFGLASDFPIVGFRVPVNVYSEHMKQIKRTRQPKPAGEVIRRGVLVQTRFGRSMYPAIQSAAAAEGLPISTWIRRLVCVALGERQRQQMESNSTK
jgi:hypothetical protein